MFSHPVLLRTPQIWLDQLQETRLHLNFCFLFPQKRRSSQYYYYGGGICTCESNQIGDYSIRLRNPSNMLLFRAAGNATPSIPGMTRPCFLFRVCCHSWEKRVGVGMMASWFPHMLITRNPLRLATTPSTTHTCTPSVNKHRKCNLLDRRNISNSSHF